MGFMNKLNKMKSFLFDEEDEKEDKGLTKKNERKEIKQVPRIEKRETNKEEIEELYFEDVSDEIIPAKTEISSRVKKKEPEFSFPEFDDDDFMVATKKPEPIVPVKKEEPKRVLYQGSKRKEENKKFKPSPIISPIYGLLDSEGNTVKEESSFEKKQSYNDEVSLDDVRKKAYGKLDSEMEDTLKRLSKKTIEEAENDMREELSRAKKKTNKPVVEPKNIIEQDIDEDDDDDDMILPNVNFREIDVDKETSKVKKENGKKVVEKKVEEVSDEDDDDDDTKEQDLFNLIDTMYQNKEEE